MLQAYKRRFFDLALRKGNLRFGEFTLKSGRISPYFFDAGGFDDGESLAALARCYADAIAASGLAFDMLFGPAYKGIPLVAATAVALAERRGQNVPFAYNRKEAKDHGEGGVIVGRPLAGRVLIVDDVISAGTSARESIALIKAAGARPAGVVIALDRQERGEGEESATTELSRRHGIPCVAIATLDDLIRYLERPGQPSAGIPQSPGGRREVARGQGTMEAGEFDVRAIERYRERYGA